MTKTKISIAKLSRKVRSKYYLTQEDLGEVLGITQATISRIENKKFTGRKYQLRLEYLLENGLEGSGLSC